MSNLLSLVYTHITFLRLRVCTGKKRTVGEKDISIFLSWKLFNGQCLKNTLVKKKYVILLVFFCLSFINSLVTLWNQQVSLFIFQPKEVKNKQKEVLDKYYSTAQTRLPKTENYQIYIQLPIVKETPAIPLPPSVFLLHKHLQIIP